jgi:antitoxin VapB
MVPMGLNIKNSEVERLAAEVAALAGETKTEAIRRALAERRERLRYRGARRDRTADALAFLEREIWPRVPEGERGRRPTPDEEAEILGYGPEGV